MEMHLSAQNETPLQRPAFPSSGTFKSLTGRLRTDQSLYADGVRIYHKATDLRQRLHVETEASELGILLGVSMRDGHNRRVREGHRVSSHNFDEGSIYIRNFTDRYRAEIRSPFEFMLFEISDANLERALREEERQRIGNLSRISSVKDEVLLGLARALTPALARPSDASILFVDQLCVAMMTHLVKTYSGLTTAVPRTKRVLAPSYEARAKEMMRNKMDGSISATELANACGLSRSYFIYAFRETTGQTPHQWLIGQRLEHAHSLLMNPNMRLADIAAECGFSDQSHFHRAFVQKHGISPGSFQKHTMTRSSVKFQDPLN